MKVLMLTNQYPTSARPQTNPAVLHQERGLRSLGVDVEVLHVDRASRGRSAYAGLIPALLSRWRRGGYDLLHVQFGGFEALAGALVARDRAVLTFHGTDLHGGGAPSPVRLAPRISVSCSRMAALLAGGVIVVSPTLLPFLQPSVRRRAQVIPTGVDYDLFQPQPIEAARAELGLDPSGSVVLFSDVSGSSLGKATVKRRDLALAAVDRARERDSSTRLLVLSQQPYWRVPLYLNAANCLLVTSDAEGSPNIVKEALAVNLPVVSVDVGDVALRCHGVPNCQIVPRDPELLAQAVLRAFAMGRALGGRDLKRDEISIEHVCGALVSYYHTVLLRPACRGSNES